MAENALDAMMRSKGKTRGDFAKNSRVGKLLRKRGVANSPEVQRIMELPAYRWQDDDELPALAQWIQDEYGRPPRDCPVDCVCRGKGYMELRPIQAAALAAIHDYRGLLGPIRVGGGKTLISYLSGTVAGVERMMLLIPAKLRKKTVREFGKLARHWKSPPRMHIMSYELLARDRGIAELEAFRPDFVFADEGHKMKNLSAACTKRMRKYLCKTNTDAIYCDTSGTITKRSILEYYHRQNWALQDGFQPMPRDYNEVRDWADALDEKVSPTGRLMPGALYQLCTDEELLESAADTSKSTHIRIARQAYQRRLMSTPGVVGTEEMFDGAMSLQISAVDWAPGEAVSAAFETLRSDWELPDGHPVDTPSALWLAARCLVQGFYYRWDPEPPADWLYWRKEWGACQRQILKRFRDIDSPMVAAREVRSGRIPWAAPILEEWDTIKGTFKPNTVAHWIDDGAFKFCADWARKNHGIVWVNEVALGERLQREAGLPYYGRGGLCGKKEIETETGSCVASIKANSEGRNLQFQYSKNLFIAPPSPSPTAP